MSNEFKSIMEEVELNFTKLHEATSLGKLKEDYSVFERSREKLIEWVNTNFDSSEELYHQYIEKIGDFEYRLFEEYGGIPVFDDALSSDEMDELFDNYTSYFQRYGCLDSMQIISWDKTNILLEDELGIIESVVRPDVLLRN
jgi:hypothetical protein